METTKQLYERAKAASGCKTAYEFAKRYGLTRQLVSNWVNGKNSFDDDHADLIAHLLNIDPGYVMACAQAERSKSAKSRSNWARLAALALAAGLSTGASAFDNNNFSARLYEVHFTNYANKLRRMIKPRTLALI